MVASEQDYDTLIAALAQQQQQQNFNDTSDHGINNGCKDDDGDANGVRDDDRGNDNGDGGATSQRSVG